MTPDEIYSAYPRHIAKRDALRAIEKALKRLPKENQLLSSMNEECRAEWLHRRVWEYAESEAGQRGVFTPHPSTWFNQGRYLDDPKEWGGGKNSGKCEKHPESGLTPVGTCWECYAERIGTSG